MKNLFFILLFLSIDSNAQPPGLTLQQILDKHTEAMGGKENWRNFKSHIITHHGVQDDQHYTSVLTMKMPNKFRIDLQTEGLKRIKSYDGKEGWILLNDELQAMPEGEDIEMAEEAEFYGELVLAQERGHQLELLGREYLDGAQVYKIKMTKFPTDEQFYYLNAETFLEEMVAEYSEDISWKGVLFRTTFDDYRMVDGLLFPFKMSLFADDRLLRTFDTQEILVNIPVEDAVFDKDVALLRRNMRLFSKALMEQDYDFVSNAYTDDAKIFPNNQKILAGSKAISNYWKPAPDSKYKITYHRIIPEEIKVLDKEAYDYGYYEGRSIGNDGKESSWKGKYVIIWKEVELNVWKMYLDIWNRVRD